MNNSRALRVGKSVVKKPWVYGSSAQVRPTRRSALLPRSARYLKPLIHLYEKGCQMNIPPIVTVLKALWNGIDVKIDGVTFTMHEGKIYQVGTDRKGEKHLLTVDLMSVNDFITFVNKKVTEPEQFILGGIITLKNMNRLNRERRCKSDRTTR